VFPTFWASLFDIRPLAIPHAVAIAGGTKHWDSASFRISFSGELFVIPIASLFVRTIFSPTRVFIWLHVVSTVTTMSSPSSLAFILCTWSHIGTFSSISTMFFPLI